MARQELVFLDVRAHLEDIATPNTSTIDTTAPTTKPDSVRINSDTIEAMELRWERRYKE
jgi:hypothetical protein